MINSLIFLKIYMTTCVIDMVFTIYNLQQYMYFFTQAFKFVNIKILCFQCSWKGQTKTTEFSRI